MAKPLQLPLLFQPLLTPSLPPSTNFYSTTPSFPSPPYPLSTSFNQLLFNYPFFSFPSLPPLYLLQPTFIQLPLLFLPLITPSLPPSTNFYSTTPSFPSPHLIPPLYLLQPTFIQLPLLFLPLLTPSLPPSTNFYSTTPSFPSPPYPLSTFFNQLLFNYPFFSNPSLPPLYLLQPTFIQLPLLFLPPLTPSLPPSTNFYSTTPSFPSPPYPLSTSFNQLLFNYPFFSFLSLPPLYLLQPTFIQLPLLFLPLLPPSLPPSTNFYSTTPSFPSSHYPLSTSFNQLLFNYPFFSFPSLPPLYLLQPTYIQLPLLFLPLITPSLPPSTNFYSTTPSFPSPHYPLSTSFNQLLFNYPFFSNPSLPPLYLLQPTFIQLPLLFQPLLTPSLPPSTNFYSTTPSFPSPHYPLSTSFNQLLFNYPFFSFPSLPPLYLLQPTFIQLPLLFLPLI